MNKLRNDELIRVDSRNATQFDWHKLPSQISSDDLEKELAELGFGESMNINERAKNAA